MSHTLKELPFEVSVYLFKNEKFCSKSKLDFLKLI